MTSTEFNALKVDDKVRIDFDWEPRVHVHGNGFVLIKNADDIQWTDFFVVGIDDNAMVFQGWFPRENAKILTTSISNADSEIIAKFVDILRTAGKC